MDESLKIQWRRKIYRYKIVVDRKISCFTISRSRSVESLILMALMFFSDPNGHSSVPIRPKLLKMLTFISLLLLELLSEVPSYWSEEFNWLSYIFMLEKWHTTSFPFMTKKSFINLSSSHVILSSSHTLWSTLGNTGPEGAASVVTTAWELNTRPFTPGCC